MEESTLHQEFRELRTRVDSMTEMLIVIQGLMVLQATDPDGLLELGTDELRAMLRDTQQSVAQKLEIIDAVARQRSRQRPYPPTAKN